MTENVDMDDLDAFETSFFEKDVKAPAPTEVIEDDEDIIENQDETPATEDDDEDVEDALDEDEDLEEEKPQPKPRKKSAQERINELTAKTREAERREAELLRRLEALESPKEVKQDKPVATAPTSGPNPDQVGEDGEAVYPLGEFDPKYIRDLTKFVYNEEREAAKAEAAKEAEAQIIAAELKQVQEAWVERLDAFEEEVPDVREHIAELTETFASIEPSYGEYLATSIMASEFGPQIMHYLSQNIGMAQKIVASGPAAATMALGRLEARFLKEDEPAPEPKRNKKVSEAPTPPPSGTRGRSGKYSVSPDTDDLEAFEREFYKKR